MIKRVIGDCPDCGGYLLVDYDGVYEKEEYVCSACSHRFDKNLNPLQPKHAELAHSMLGNPKRVGRPPNCHGF